MFWVIKRAADDAPASNIACTSLASCCLPLPSYLSGLSGLHRIFRDYFVLRVCIPAHETCKSLSRTKISKNKSLNISNSIPTQLHVNLGHSNFNSTQTPLNSNSTYSNSSQPNAIPPNSFRPKAFHANSFHSNSFHSYSVP